MSSMLNEDRHEIDQLSLIGKYILKPEAEPQDDNDEDWDNGNFSNSNNMENYSPHNRKPLDTMNMSLQEEFYTNNNTSIKDPYHYHPVEIDDEDLDLHQVGYFDQSSSGYGNMYSQQSIENQLNDESYENLQMELQNQYQLNPYSDDFEDEEFRDPLNVPIFTVIDAYHAFTMRKRVEEANQQWGTGTANDEDAIRERQIKVQFCEDVQFFAINSRAEDEEEELNYAMTENSCALNDSSNSLNVSDGTGETLKFEQQSPYQVLEKLTNFDFDEVPNCPVSTPVSSQSDLDLNEKESISDFQISSNSSDQSLQISSQQETDNNGDSNNKNVIISMDDNVNNNFYVYNNTNATKMEISPTKKPLQPTHQFQNPAPTPPQNKIKHSVQPENTKTKVRKISSNNTKKIQSDSKDKNNSSTFSYNNITTQLLQNAEVTGQKQVKKKPIGEGVSFLSTLSKEPTQTSKLRNLLKASKFALRKNIENNRSNSNSISSSSSMYSNNFNLIISSDSKSHLTTTSTHYSSSSNTKVKTYEGRSNNNSNNMSTFPVPNNNNNSNLESSQINPILQSILDPVYLNVLSKSKSCTQSNIVLRELKTQILRHKIQKSTLEQKLSKRIINMIYNDSSLNSGQPPPTSYHQQTVSSKSKTKTSVGSRNTTAAQSFQNNPINFSGRSKWASKPEFISFAKKLESLRTSDQLQQQQNQNNIRKNNSTTSHYHQKQFSSVNFEKIGDHNRDKDKRKSKLDLGYNSLSINRKDFLSDTQSKLNASSVKARTTVGASQKKMSIPRHSHPSLSRVVKT